MTDMSLVSIILPTYNGSRYLERAIHSCLQQTYPYWELIIIDDASTDDTPDQILLYTKQDSRIRSVRHETNQKLPAALNTGFSFAKGGYLTWTSDDNCYKPHALGQMVNFLAVHLEIDLVYSDYSTINEEGDITSSISVLEPECLLQRNVIGPCFLYRRKVYKEIGNYAENLFLAEDYDYWLRIFTKFHLQALHENLYLYRLHSSSLTTTKRQSIALATEKALLLNLPFMKWTDRKLRAMAYFQLALSAWSRQEYRAVSAHLLNLFFLSPQVFSTAISAELIEKLRRSANLVTNFMSPKSN